MVTMLLEIHHTTTYRYSSLVRFGEHRLMLRPSDSHDLRLLDEALVLSPSAQVRHIHDVFGNSVALASFGEAEAMELRVESRLVVEQRVEALGGVAMGAGATLYPFCYPAEELPELGGMLVCSYPDTAGQVARWARSFLRARGATSTLALLTAMTRSVRDGFVYEAREEQGTRTPEQTLRARRGACRDFALLLMEGCRSLGIAARFVSGYLYDAAAEAYMGGGAMHAWVQVYLPGAGWVELDPTHGIVGGQGLVRVAVTRDPAQAVPVSGSFIGALGCCLGMSVEVVVRRRPWLRGSSKQSSAA